MASTAVTPAEISACVQEISVPPDETISSTNSAGWPAIKSESVKVTSTERSPRRVFRPTACLSRSRLARSPTQGPELLIGPNDDSVVRHVSGTQGIGNGRHRRKVITLDAREDLFYSPRAMQMRIDSNDAIEAARKQGANDPLIDRLTSMKGGILTHIAKIRSSQDQSACAFATKRFSREKQCQQLVIRPVERRINDACRRRRSDSHAKFAIREGMYIDRMKWNPKPGCKALRIANGRRKRMNGCFIHRLLARPFEPRT